MGIQFGKQWSHTLFLHWLWISVGTLSTPLNKFWTASAWIISLLWISNGNFQKQNGNFRLKWHLVGTYDRTPPKFEWKTLRGQRKRWELCFSMSFSTHTRKLCIYTYIDTDMCMCLYMCLYMNRIISGRINKSGVLYLVKAWGRDVEERFIFIVQLFFFLTVWIFLNHIHRFLKKKIKV